MKTPKRRPGSAPTRIVGSVHTPRGLRDAARLRPGGGVDVVEVRLDCLQDEEGKLAALLRETRLPILLTARHPREGGAAKLSTERRRNLLETFLSFASMVDFELRSAHAFPDLLASARKRRIRIVLSSHHFGRAPGLAKFTKTQTEARRLGADICQIAVHLNSASDLARLLLVQARASYPLATMGMGPLGKVSRLVLPLAGSRLVYGYIDRPQVEGQWPAALLAERLREVAP